LGEVMTVNVSVWTILFTLIIGLLLFISVTIEARENKNAGDYGLPIWWRTLLVILAILGVILFQIGRCTGGLGG
jgi:phosphatidylglycerophosphate synthase